MASHEQLKKPTQHDAERMQEEAAAQQQAQDAARRAQVSEDGEKLKAELDDLLDAVDEVLEVNAEDFVKSYIQKGGQ